jgi:hypothetical protein
MLSQPGLGPCFQTVTLRRLENGASRRLGAKDVDLFPRFLRVIPVEAEFSSLETAIREFGFCLALSTGLQGGIDGSE